VHGITRVLREAALWVTAVLGTLSILAAVAAVGFGITPLIFRSGSMSPEIPTGSLGLAQRADALEVRVGDIVSVVWSDDTRVTHRVVGIADQGAGFVELETRGDANERADIEHPVIDRVDRVFWTVPGAGYVFQEITKPYWIFGSGVAVGAIVMLSLLRPRSRSDDEADAAEASEGDRPLVSADWPPTGRVDAAGGDDPPLRHAGHRSHGRHGRSSAAVLAGAVLLVSLAIVPAPIGTLAAFMDPAAAAGTFSTLTTAPVTGTVTCAVTPTGLGAALAQKTVTLGWTAPAGIAPTKYTVTWNQGSRDVAVGTTTTSFAPGQAPVELQTFTVRAVYGSWASAGVSRNVLYTTGLLVTCL
jgi:signal peptidase I